MNAQLNGVVMQANHRDVARRYKNIGLAFAPDNQPTEIHTKLGGVLD